MAVLRLDSCRRQSPTFSSLVEGIARSLLHRTSFYCTVSSSLLGDHGEEQRKEGSKWLTLPAFAPQKDPSSVAKELNGGTPPEKEELITSLKWVHRCFPQLPMSLVQKLFRLRQVRKKLVSINASSGIPFEGHQLRRVSAKDLMRSGDVILLPITVQSFTKEKNEQFDENHKEIKFIRSLILYKDPAIIVINKPHGLPVQGGFGIKNSVDILAATSLKFDYSESPRLVHRLDRDCSGLLVLGRTQISTSILHSIFREKTLRVLKDNFRNAPRALQRKYWALVIGTPKHSSGLLSAPIGKVVFEDGKSERITVIKVKPTPSQHALTEYKVIKTCNGFTWLELCPLTGRKHQLRVHCAEVLRTPIVGDYKYGWHAHRKWEPIETASYTNKLPKGKLPFKLNFEEGSISENHPRLHLHCRQMILPSIAEAVEHLQPSSAMTNCELTELDMLNLVAPLPTFMQLSWDILRF